MVGTPATRVGTECPVPPEDPGPALPPQASVTFLGTLSGLESPATEGLRVGGEIEEPHARGGRAPEHKEGWVRRGSRESSVGLLPQCFASPLSSEPPGWRKSQQALCFLFLAAAGSCSHICSCSSCCGAPSSLLFSLLPLALLPAMYTLNSSTDTHGPIVFSAPFLALWFPDEAS